MASASASAPDSGRIRDTNRFTPRASKRKNPAVSGASSRSGGGVWSRIRDRVLGGRDARRALDGLAAALRRLNTRAPLTPARLAHDSKVARPVKRGREQRLREMQLVDGDPRPLRLAASSRPDTPMRLPIQPLGVLDRWRDGVARFSRRSGDLLVRRAACPRPAITRTTGFSLDIGGTIRARSRSSQRV
jgi:hypothetical protein